VWRFPPCYGLSRKYHAPRRDDESGRPSLRDWLHGEFDIWQTHIKGTDAAIAILLPLAAVSIGMTIFAILRHIVGGG
jgi:hypothetical protein